MARPLTSTASPLHTTIFDNHSRIKQTIVFVHGIGGDHTAFDFVIKDLSPRLPHTRFVTYDLRGHARSPQSFQGTHSNLEDIHLEDLQTLINDTLKGQLFLIGQSLGSMVIQEYLRRKYKPTPQHTFLICTTLSSPALFLRRQWWFKRWQQRQPATQLRPALLRTADDHLKYKGSFDYHLGRIWSDIQTMTFYSWFMHWTSFLGWANPEPQILNSARVTFIYGARDRIIWPVVQRRVRQFLPKAHHFAVNSNHNCIVNVPHEVAKVIAEEIGQ